MGKTEFYNIEILKTRGKGKKKEFLVHYVKWSNTYDKWKKQKMLNKYDLFHSIATSM